MLVSRQVAWKPKTHENNAMDRQHDGEGRERWMRRKETAIPVFQWWIGHHSWIRKRAMYRRRRRVYDGSRTDIRMGKLESLVELVGGLLSTLPTDGVVG